MLLVVHVLFDGHRLNLCVLFVVLVLGVHRLAAYEKLHRQMKVQAVEEYKAALNEQVRIHIHVKLFKMATMYICTCISVAKQVLDLMPVSHTRCDQCVKCTCVCRLRSSRCASSQLTLAVPPTIA